MRLTLFLACPEVIADAGWIARQEALRILLGKGDIFDCSAHSREAALYAQFDPDCQAPPFAAVRARGDGLAPDSGHWVCLDPIHLEAQRDELIAFEVPDLRVEEARELARAVDDFLAGEGVRMEVGAAQRWYARVGEAARVCAPSVSRVLGRALAPHMLQGADARLWMSRLSEIQMLLHTHPVNQARESADQLTVNALWLWGSGASVEPLRAPFDRVYADDALSRGLAHAAGISHQPLPGGLADLPDTGRALVVLLAPTAEALEQRWCAPLLQALRARRVDDCDVLLWTEQALGVHLRPSHLWRFWRRPLSFQAASHG